MPFERDAIAASYSRRLERNEVYRRCGYDPSEAIAFVLRQALPLTGRVLEIGTGKGRFLSALAWQADRVVTLDNNPREQDQARMNVAFEGTPQNITFLLGDAARLPWKEATFDHVASMNALHHMTRLRRVLDEIRRVVKPGGTIVLSDFNEEGFAVMDRIHRDEGRVHERITYRFDEVQDMLSTAGDRVRRQQGAGQEILVVSSSPSPGSRCGSPECRPLS
jgi:SAM-dependent methyltransferase